MSKHLKRKIALLVVMVVAGMVVMGTVLSAMQGSLTISSYTEEMREKSGQLRDQLETAKNEDQQNTETYDAVYQAMAASVAFMANNDPDFSATDAEMASLKDLLGVDNVLVVHRDGSVVAKAADDRADFSYARFNELRETFDTNEPSPAVEVELPDQNWHMRYYASAINADTMAVVEREPSELTQLLEDTSSQAAVLKDVTVGQHGYVFAVSAKDYLITYHPDSTLVGADAIDAGINAADLEDGTFSHMTLNGQRLYCGVTKVGDTYYICAVPESDLASSRTVTVGVILFAFFVVVAAVVLYGVFVMRDDERRAHDPEQYTRVGPLRFNRTIAAKAVVLSFVGFLAVVGVSYYMQTLFALSSQSLTNAERAQSIATTIKNTNDRASDLTDQYSARNLSKARIAAKILEGNPALATQPGKLHELSQALGVEYTYVFDEMGKLTASDSGFTNFTLSDDPNDQSYAFRSLLSGVESVVQEPQNDEVSGELRQYIGVCLRDADGTVHGFVQISVQPTLLANALTSLKIDKVLGNVKVGSRGFVAAVNKSDDTIAYYPLDQGLVGKDARDLGLTDAQLKGGYSDYMTMNGTRFFASTVDTGDYIIYAANTEAGLMTDRVPLTLTTAGVALVCMVLTFLVLTFSPAPRAATGEAGAGSGASGDGPDGNGPDGGSPAAPKRPADGMSTTGARTYVAQMPDGRSAKTESAVSRWLDQSFSWGEKSPEQKLGTVLRWFASLFVIVVFIAVVFKDRFFASGSIFAYILGGAWQHGLNIFAITASIMFACVAVTVAGALKALLRMLSRVLGSRGETMCRLLSSVVKYATVIGSIYYCLALIGVDTSTLLASAGLLTFAVSLGAKDLVGDIISGLFIIFEGEFRVGDIIQVGANKGTVMDIGVRTTKINDGSGNVLVLRNSNISNVINMTKELSFASLEVGIEYGESIERVESILSRELPKIAKRIPAIVDGPFYKGISSLADNSVNIKIVAKCREADKGGVTSDLNREMKLLFDRFNIAIPYPQIVVNQPTVFKKATRAERAEADRFNAEQKEASRGVGGNEDEDFDESNDSHRG